MEHKYNVLFENEARLDIADSFDYYSKISTQLANTFLNDIQRTMEYVENSPSMFKIVYKGYRQVPSKKFPYIILYKHEKQTIKVYRVFPTRKNPKTRFAK